MKKTSKRPNSSQARNILERLNILCTKMKEVDAQHKTQRSQLLREFEQKQKILLSKQLQAQCLLQEYDYLQQYVQEYKSDQEVVEDEQIKINCLQQLKTEQNKLLEKLIRLQIQNNNNDKQFQKYYHSLGLEPLEGFLEQIKRAQKHLFE